MSTPIPPPGQGLSEFLGNFASELYVQGFVAGRRSILDYGFSTATELIIMRYFKEFANSGDLVQAVENALAKAGG